MDRQHRSTNTVNITMAERTLRASIGAAALIAIVAGTAGTPQLIFILSVLGAYLIQTGTTGKDPVYALARYMQAANRLQVWQHTVTTGLFLPVLIAGDLISSFFVFCLSALGGFVATTTMVGRDLFDALTLWSTHRKKSAPMGVSPGYPRKEAPV